MGKMMNREKQVGWVQPTIAGNEYIFGGFHPPYGALNLEL